EVRDLTVGFGGLMAVDHVDLKVDAGTVVGLIGPNGAGKTTFIDALTGFVPTQAGEVLFDGARLEQSPAHERARRGLARTFQGVELFDDLTVLENLQVASDRPRWWAPLTDIVRPRRPIQEDAVQWALATLGLEAVADRLPAELPHGQRKMVGVARALAARPKLLLTDEPAAGLDGPETAVLGSQLRQLLDHNITVLVVDHDMALVMTVCDYMYVLDFGKIIAQGTPAEVRRNPKVVRAYLGEKSFGDRPLITGVSDSPEADS
ncbi:MAG: ABC transporter ATP-binding protein, partial [Acidimicrobiia bacterium]